MHPNQTMKAREVTGEGAPRAVSPVPPSGIAISTSTRHDALTAKFATSRVTMTLATNVTIMVVGAGTGILTARLLGPIGEGQLAAIQTWPLLLGTLAMFGLPEALVYFIAREPDRGRQLTTTAVLLGLSGSVLIGAIAWVAMPTLLSSQHHAIVDAARVFLLVGVVYAVFGIPHGALRGAHQFGAWNLVRIAPGLAWLVILLCFWALGGAAAIPLSRWFLLGMAAAGAPFLALVTRRLNGPLRPRARDTGRLLRFGFPSVLSTIPQTINLRLDQLLIVAFLPARDLGLYVVAVAWSGIIVPVLSAIGSVLFPVVSADSDERRKVQALTTALQGALIIGIAAATTLAAAAPFGIRLVFGARFGGAVPAALVLVPATSMLAWAGVAEEGLRGLGRPGLVLVAEIVAAAVTVAALPPLLHFVGILGAATASLLGYAMVAFVCAFTLSRSTGAPRRAFVIPTARTIAIFAGQGQRLLSRAKSRGN